MKKGIIIVAIYVLLTVFSSDLYASSFLNDVFGQASDFVDVTDPSIGKYVECKECNQLNPVSNHKCQYCQKELQKPVGAALSGIISNGTGGLDIIGTIFAIGNVVIFVVTIALGLKYIYSGIEGKADIKSSLPNYVLGVVFFYLAQSVRDLSKSFMTGALGGGTSYNTFAGNVYSTVNTIANVCAILGIVLLGLKYMLSPAETRADVKKQLVPVALGIVLVYCTFKVITLVYSIGQGVLS